jgi:ribosomal protein S18 acetylase RimI-like enzyme
VGEEAEILTLVITPLSQRGGKGSILLEALFDRLIQKGISQLFLEVAEDNEQAQSFYIKHGFIFVSKRHHYYQRKENQCVSALNFFKRLA